MKKIAHITLCILDLVFGLAFFSADRIPSIYAEDASQTIIDVDTEESTVVVESLPQSSLAYTLFTKIKTSWPWYITRASGLVAGFLLVVLMLSGTGFITGSTFRFFEPISAWATHRSLGIMLGIAVVVHVVSLYFDTFTDFDVAALLIPFASNLRPIELFGVSVGSLYVALGIFALYVFFAIIVTSLIWVEKKPRTWKAIHILSYVGMTLVFFHAFFLGTDLAQGTLRYVWVGAGVLVALGALQRLWRTKTV